MAAYTAVLLAAPFMAQALDMVTLIVTIAALAALNMVYTALVVSMAAQGGIHTILNILYMVILAAFHIPNINHRIILGILYILQLIIQFTDICMAITAFHT